MTICWHGICGLDAFTYAKIATLDAARMVLDAAAYKKYAEKAAGKSEIRQHQDAEDMMNLFFEFGEMKAMEPGCAKVQALVKKLQDFISENYYTCTKEIFCK